MSTSRVQIFEIVKYRNYYISITSFSLFDIVDRIEAESYLTKYVIYTMM